MRFRTRRDVLRLGAATGVAALLAACGESGAGNAPATTTTVTQPTPASGAIPIRIVDSGVQLPTENVSFHWVDSGDVKAFFWKAYFPAYQKAHPNITVQYDALPWNEINKVVPLGSRMATRPMSSRFHWG